MPTIKSTQTRSSNKKKRSHTDCPATLNGPKNRYVAIDYLTQNVEIVKVKDIPKVKDDLSILVTNAEGKRKKIVIENPIITKHNSIQKELEDFYHCILENQKPKVSLLDGARALEVAKKIMECI